MYNYFVIEESVMEKEIEKMIEAVVEDYRDHVTRVGSELMEDVPRPWMLRSKIKFLIRQFERDFEIKTGREYIEVMYGHAPWTFVVNTDDDDMFDKGDILMSKVVPVPRKSFARPWTTDRSQAMGNVLKGDLSWIKGRPFLDQVERPGILELIN